MTTFYLSSVDGNNADDGLSWANAVATLKYAVETLAASGGPHTILVDSAHSESLSADTTITAAQDLQIISVNRASGNAPLAGASIGAQATNFALTLQGNDVEVYVFGVTFADGTNNSVHKIHTFNVGQRSVYEFEGCTFSIGIGIAIFNQTIQATTCLLKNCTFRFRSIAGTVRFYAKTQIVGGGVDPTGSDPNVFQAVPVQGVNVSFSGFDASHCSKTLINPSAGSGVVVMRQCKLHPSVTIRQTDTSSLNTAGVHVELFDCAAGDIHCGYFHADTFGSTIQDTGIHAGATSGGSSVSYKIVTNPNNCSFYTPYMGPWIAKPHTGTASVVPGLEILRDGSSVAYQDDEVWAEWQYKGTSGEVTVTTVSARMALLGTPANQATGDLGAGDWTGENATAWFGKLHYPAGIIPQESGAIFGRVVVGKPSVTVYVDPQIRLT
jgi:hypothetical protein